MDTVKQAEIFAAIRAGLRHPARRQAQAARLPDAGARHPVRARPPARSGGRRRSGGASAPAARRPRLDAGRSGQPRRADDEVRERVLAIVAEKTGYPPDMLDLDLDLEADLGVDTVKQAEIFAAIRAGLRHPARRQAQAARLPDAGARDPVRARPAASRGRRRPHSRRRYPKPRARLSRPPRRRLASTPPSACRAACRYRCSVRRSTSASRPACRWRRAAGCS